jgi:hypothetical protein
VTARKGWSHRWVRLDSSWTARRVRDHRRRARGSSGRQKLAGGMGPAFGNGRRSSWRATAGEGMSIGNPVSSLRAGEVVSPEGPWRVRALWNLGTGRWKAPWASQSAALARRVSGSLGARCGAADVPLRRVRQGVFVAGSLRFARAEQADANGRPLRRWLRCEAQLAAAGGAAPIALLLGVDEPATANRRRRGSERSKDLA